MSVKTASVKTVKLIDFAYGNKNPWGDSIDQRFPQRPGGFCGIIINLRYNGIVLTRAGKGMIMSILLPAPFL